MLGECAVCPRLAAFEVVVLQIELHQIHRQFPPSDYLIQERVFVGLGRMRSNSLFRALRVDKLTYAALESTLLAYVKQDFNSIPTLRMISLSKDEIGGRADAVAKQINSDKLKAEVIDGESVIGGGAAPSSVLPTKLLALTAADLSADELSARLRKSNPSIVARVEEGRVLLDLRTVFPGQDTVIASVLRSIA